MQTDVRPLPTIGRVLLVIDQPVLTEYVRLALRHATYRTYVVPDRGGHRRPRSRSGSPISPSST